MEAVQPRPFAVRQAPPAVLRQALDSERGEAKQVKEALVAEAEAWPTSTDWGATAGAYRDLMARWKASGRAGKADEDELWSRFRAAQDAFFAPATPRSASATPASRRTSPPRRPSSPRPRRSTSPTCESAKVALRSIQERWEKVGHVPRGDKERVEARLRRVEESLRRGEQDQWRRTNPEAKARAEATVEQFQGSLAKLEKAAAPRPRPRATPRRSPTPRAASPPRSPCSRRLRRPPTSSAPDPDHRSRAPATRPPALVAQHLL